MIEITFEYYLICCALLGIGGVASHQFPSVEVLPRDANALWVAQRGNSRPRGDDEPRGTPPCDPGGCPRPLVNRNIPHIITPRQTFVAGDRLLLRWHEPAEIERYTVTLSRRRDGETWTTQVSGNSLIYQGVFLEPGTRVVVTVNAHNGEQRGESQFSVLSSQDQDNLNQQLSQLEHQDLSEVEEVLATVEVYEQFQNLANGIDVLYQAINTLPDSPELYCRLALIYQNQYPELRQLNLSRDLQNQAQQLGSTCPESLIPMAN